MRRRRGILLLLFGLMCVASAHPTTARPTASCAGTNAMTAASPGSGSITRIIITPANQGQILRLAVGETFLLRLGDGIWDVQITKPQILELDHGAKLSSGDQGIYRARAAGLTELVAVAAPHCIGDSPPCRVMTPAFRVLIVVH